MKMQIFTLATCLVLFVNVVSAADSKRWGYRSDDATVGPHLLTAKRATVLGPDVLKKFPPTKYRIFEIDLDQDGTLDYIVEALEKRETCFVKSDFTIQSCEKYKFEAFDGFAYEFFISTGQNRMLLLLDLSGEEESSTFSIESFDQKNWKKKKIVAVNTLIKVDSQKYKGLYWGYPWDIKDLIVTSEKGEQAVQIVFGNIFDKDPTGPKTSALVFSGMPTQGGAHGEYDKLVSKIDLVPLKDLEKRLKAGR